MYQINIIYVKELTELSEIFSKYSKLPVFLKKFILYFKKVFGIATINENGICIVPYKNMEKFLKIKMYYIRNILLKLNSQVILSNYLDSIEELRQKLINSNIKLLVGTSFSNYLIPEIINYICKVTNKKLQEQEITILIKQPNTDNLKLISSIAKNVKEIKIVTTNILSFQKLEKDLEDQFGVACQITNNKRKSLAKSKIIVNLDFSEEFFNRFTLNTNAIVIDVNKKIHISSKAFAGIHVCEYELITDNEHMIKNEFTIRKLYEST